ncbi:MAG: alpha-2-macroglobulin, partial [Prevotella sp.]|nr:alpha-2-macroglobulin [Prevotella sp.]
QQAKSAKDPVLQAVYATVLASIYKDQGDRLDNWRSHYDEHYAVATAHPELLAAVKANVYAPFVVDGKDSRIYDNDLLSLVGSELKAWQWLSDYYTGIGNRPAACMAAFYQLHVNERHTLIAETRDGYMARLDSLIALYGDLPEAGEVAIERYNIMSADVRYTLSDKAEWLQQSISRWGSWQRANVLRNMWSQLTAPMFTAETEQMVLSPGEPLDFKAQLRNVQSLTMRLFSTKLDGETDLNPADDADYKKMKSGLTEMTAWTNTYTYAPKNEYEMLSETFSLKGLPATGVYMLEFSTQPATKVVRRLLFVSGLRLMMLPMPDNKLRYVVVDAQTGKPVEGASLKLKFDAGWRKPMTSKTIKSDADGEAVYKYADNRQPSQVFVSTGSDNSCPQTNLYGRYSYYERQYGNEHTSLFTDRSIYRPGQTVRVTGIVWKEKNATEQAAVADKMVEMELRDANYKQLSRVQVTTDRYGKCSTEFTLPEGLLNGHFTVRCNGNSVSFRVEEYKRPTFQVTFDEYKESYQAGDTVTAHAKAATYAGVPVQGAVVKYTVKRRVAFWWMTYSRYWEGGSFGIGSGDEIMSEGETTTSDDGTFSIPMPMTLPYNLGNRPMFYHFVAEAEVTDMGGETRSGTMSLPLGSRPTALTCDLPQQVRSDQMPKVTFERRNAAGKQIGGKVKYRIDGSKWKEVAANSQLSILGTQLKSGDHQLMAVCENDTVDVKFTVFSLNDKKAVIGEGEWFYVSDRQFPSDGSPITIQVGAVSPEIHVVYAVFAGDKVIDSGRADRKNGELLVRKLSYKEEYGNGVLAVFSWVRDGKAHAYETHISRPVPNRNLRLTWETFRDRLTPGQQEEWTLRVQKPDGSPADASLMAVLYDKSLDQIYPHQWHFSPSSYLSLPSSSWTSPYWGGISAYGAKDYKSLPAQSLRFSSFDHSVYPVYFAAPMAMGGIYATKRMMKSNVMAIGAAPEMAAVDYAEAKMTNSVMASADVADAVAEDEMSSLADDASVQQEDAVQVRENLSETAFCYPALQTDSLGRVVLRFTLPESLTTWRFMGISNTTDMLCGMIDGEAVASKEVMVQPNVPRFIRMGDVAEITARIFNTGEKTVGGKARLQLSNAADGELVMEQEMDFTAEAGGSTAVTFKIDASWLTESLLVCKVTASGDGFADGEQHYLPILSDREQVTKTVPFTQHEPSVKTIDLAALFPAGSTGKLTVEYTNNPVWLMVQSLPVLGQPWEKSAIDQAACYYSNQLAQHLLSQSPQVKNVFEQWKRDSYNTPLASQLSKNQELKDLLLSETPWVAEADGEAEQRQRLADFFDENTINNRLATAVKKLGELQNGDGSFSWYPGMKGTTSITVSVAEMLARLTVMTGQQKDVKQIGDKAFGYLSDEMVDLVAEMKREEKRGHKPSFPSFTALRWLYLCAIDGRQLSAKVKNANEYLIALMKKDIKRQTIYEKALSAVILAKHGEAKTAAQYVKSLKEYSVCTDEMGRYYDTPRATYSWYDYKIPTEVAAIEAIQTVTPADRQTVDEMRRWLLQEKRTQSWDTPISSVNAIYAFLAGNSTKLLAVKEPTTLAIDGSPVSVPQAVAGLGYVKTVVTAPTGKTLTATKTSEGTSWGAVYAQFMQKTSEVAASQSGISVKREILLDGNAVDLSSSTPQLSVGTRIKVRITIDASRDLDFVQVVDRRAACMEPVKQLSGYRNGAYCSPKDYATNYYFDRMAKGKHVIETDYYIDRAGTYETGTCTAGCAYAPEYRGVAPSVTLRIGE